MRISPTIRSPVAIPQIVLCQFAPFPQNFPPQNVAIPQIVLHPFAAFPQIVVGGTNRLCCAFIDPV